jgi:hypothetical protein
MPHRLQSTQEAALPLRVPLTCGYRQELSGNPRMIKPGDGTDQPSDKPLTC